MENRDEYLVALRPDIPSAKVNDTMSADEQFQNRTLRPVAKLQHDLLVEVFRNYIKKHKNVFYGLTAVKRIDYIENAVNRDQKFRNSLKGIIMGMFAISVLFGAMYRALDPVIPEATTMGVIGGMALVANLICAVLLLGFKDTDINMRSAWLCSRNDVLANIGVLLAAAGVRWTDSSWPDLIVGVALSALILKSSIEILRVAKLEMANHQIT